MDSFVHLRPIGFQNNGLIGFVPNVGHGHSTNARIGVVTKQKQYNAAFPRNLTLIDFAHGKTHKESSTSLSDSSSTRSFCRNAATIGTLTRRSSWDGMKQHHAVVKRMVDEGNLAIAGPFQFSDQGELRGVAIFRVRAEQTAKLTQDDPIVKAGLLKPEIHPWAPGKGVLASGQPMQ